MANIEKIKKGRKSVRLSVLCQDLTEIKEFYSNCLKIAQKNPFLFTVELMGRLETMSYDIDIVLESISQAKKIRGGKLDAPSLDCVMDNIVATGYLIFTRNNMADCTAEEMSFLDLLENKTNEFRHYLHDVYFFMNDLLSE